MKDNKNLLWKYAGLATQFLVGLAVMVYAGFKADGWMHTKIPILVWILPLILLLTMLWQIVKDTGNDK